MTFESVYQGSRLRIPNFDGAVGGWDPCQLGSLCVLYVSDGSQQLAIHLPFGENLTAATPLL